MSKPIKMTEEYLAECRECFEAALKQTRLSDGKVNFTKTFSVGEHKATVFFTGEAWTKMVMLLNEFDKEVAWHGVAYRGEDESKDEYYITDIVVYPQTVTGSTVEMDTESYASWIMDNIEDERFEHIHMQGHSHVNMGTTPSSVDLNHQEEILNMLGDEDFYIFMIWNKSFRSTNKIYDMKKNIMFEDSDIAVKITGGEEDLDAFIKSAKEMVKSKTYTTYTGYTGAAAPAAKQTPIGSPYDPLKTQKCDASKKGKKKEKKKVSVNAAMGYSGRNACDDYDDEDDPYGPFGYWGGDRYGAYR